MTLYAISLGKTSVDVVEAVGAQPPNRNPDLPPFSISTDLSRRTGELIGAVLPWLNPTWQIQVTVDNKGSAMAWIEPLPKPRP